MDKLRFPFLCAVLACFFSAPLFSQTLSVEDLIEGRTVTLKVAPVNPGFNVAIGYSLAGPGPISTGFGDIELSDPVTHFTIRVGSSGEAVLQGAVPPGTGGIPIWFYAVVLNPGFITNPLAEIIQFNVAPVINTALPDEADQGSALTLSLLGNFFDPGSEIKLVGASTVVEATGENFVSNDEINGELDLVAIPSGAYDIVVTKPNGLVGQLDGGFFVVNQLYLNDIGPSLGDQYSTVDFSISGSCIDPGSSVSLVQGTTVIAGTNVTINQNGTELSASVALSVVPFGLYDVEIVEPSGLTEILPAAFEIMPSAMAYIPEGSFEMGDHKNTPNPDEQPIHDVTLDAFWMNKYETTNSLFADYLNGAYTDGLVTVANDIVTQVGGIMATVCNLAPTALDSCISWNGTSFEVSVGNEDKPVVETSWFGGALYANYLSASEGKGRVYHPLTWVINYNSDGYRMPTEAEWEYAARGSYRYLRFPWGGTIDADDCNYNNNIGDVTNVGSYPYNGYGLYDMSGNVFERCNDWYDANYYAVSPGSNPTGPSSSTSSGRVQRGGSFRGSQDQVRCANRGYDGAEATHNHVGIRLVLPIQ